jgi:hypothetical protein
MKNNRMQDAREKIARRGSPEDANLWPRISAQFEKDAVIMKPLKLTWSLALVILALILATTAAYALYHYFLDPGLKNVRDQGLVKDINSTARPSVLPPATPFGGTSQPATLVGASQTLDGVTLTLDWVYLLDGRQVFHISSGGLAGGMRFGMPEVTYADVPPEQYRGAIFSLDESDSGTFVSSRILRKNGEFGGQVDMQIDIPLKRQDGTQISVFHFDVKNVPVIVPMGGGGGDSYAVRVNGLEMRLEHAIVTPAYTEVRLCYEPPSVDKNWRIGNVTVQFGDSNGYRPGGPVVMDHYVQLDGQCADVTFPIGKHAGDIFFTIAADGLLPDDDPSFEVDSMWQFQTSLIDDMYVEGISPTPVAEPPLASQEVGDLKATLNWAYADANRVAFQIHFDGWKENYMLASGALVKDRTGKQLGYAYNIQTSEADPSTMIVIFNPNDPAVLENVDHIDLQIDLPVYENSDSPFASFHFDLSLKVYPALVLAQGTSVVANGIEMRIEKIRMSPSYTNLYLCFKKPTTGLPSDWLISQNTTLQIGDIKVNSASGGTLFDADYGGYMGKGPKPGDLPSMDGGRCMELGFPLGHRNRAETMTLTIPQLEQSMPEVIPDAEVKKAQEKLRAQGIEMDWMTFSGNGGGGGGPVYKKLPPGMTEQEAYQRFIEALGYIYQGPWTFTIKIQP